MCDYYSRNLCLGLFLAVFWTKRSGLCFGLNNKPMAIQGWMELAGARYSMGASRVNTALLNLQPHSAATTVEITHNKDGNSL